MVSSMSHYMHRSGKIGCVLLIMFVALSRESRSNDSCTGLYWLTHSGPSGKSKENRMVLDLSTDTIPEEFPSYLGAAAEDSVKVESNAESEAVGQENNSPDQKVDSFSSETNGFAQETFVSSLEIILSNPRIDALSQEKVSSDEVTLELLSKKSEPSSSKTSLSSDKVSLGLENAEVKAFIKKNVSSVSESSEADVSFKKNISLSVKREAERLTLNLQKTAPGLQATFHDLKSFEDQGISTFRHETKLERLQQEALLKQSPVPFHLNLEEDDSFSNRNLSELEPGKLKLSEENCGADCNKCDMYFDNDTPVAEQECVPSMASFCDDCGEFSCYDSWNKSLFSDEQESDGLESLNFNHKSAKIYSHEELGTNEYGLSPNSNENLTSGNKGVSFKKKCSCYFCLNKKEPRSDDSSSTDSSFEQILKAELGHISDSDEDLTCYGGLLFEDECFLKPWFADTNTPENESLSSNIEDVFRNKADSPLFDFSGYEDRLAKNDPEKFKEKDNCPYVLEEIDLLGLEELLEYEQTENSSWKIVNSSNGEMKIFYKRYVRKGYDSPAFVGVSRFSQWFDKSKGDSPVDCEEYCSTDLGGRSQILTVDGSELDCSNSISSINDPLVSLKSSDINSLSDTMLKGGVSVPEDKVNCNSCADEKVSEKELKTQSHSPSFDFNGDSSDCSYFDRNGLIKINKSRRRKSVGSFEYENNVKKRLSRAKSF